MAEVQLSRLGSTEFSDEQILNNPSRLFSMFRLGDTLDVNPRDYIARKMGTFRQKRVQDLSTLAHVDPLSYHKIFVELNNSLKDQIRELVLNVARGLILIGKEEDVSIKQAIEMVRPFSDKLMDEFHNALETENKSLDKNIKAWVNQGEPGNLDDSGLRIPTSALQEESTEFSDVFQSFV